MVNRIESIKNIKQAINHLKTAIAVLEEEVVEWCGKALEVQALPEGSFVRPGEAGFRAIVWERLGGYSQIADIYEANTLTMVINVALCQHPDTSFAKHGQKVAQPTEISVSECARAMAGIW